MLDILTAIFIDAVGTVNPIIKEDTSRSLAEARRQSHRQRERQYGMAAQIDAAIDSAMAESDRVLQSLDPLYRHRLNHERRQYGLPPIAA